MVCEAGPCGQTRPLSQLTSTVETQFLVIQANRLSAGATYRFTCMATQVSSAVDASCERSADGSRQMD